MPVYGTPQSGSNPVSGKNLKAIYPGDRYTLFDGTETVANNLASVAFARAMMIGSSDNGASFFMTGAPSGLTMSVQASNTDVDADYLTLTTLTGDTNGNAAYTDIGRPTFYRVQITAYSSGAMPVVIVQR